MTPDPLWITLQAVVWAFGLRAAVELRTAFGRDALTWTAFVWAVTCCLVMDLALLGQALTTWPPLTFVAVTSGVSAAVLMGLTVHGLLSDLRSGTTRRARLAWDRVGLAGLAVLALTASLEPGDTVIAIIHVLEGGAWLCISAWAGVSLARRGFDDPVNQVFRPRILSLAFAASFVHASLTPTSVLTGWRWPAGVGPLAGTLFILTVVTSLYGTLLRVRGKRLTDAERQVREAQEQLFNVEKLVAVGTLAAGAAHDFNNALTVIQGSAQLALDDPTLTGQSRRDVETVVRAAIDAGSISRNLLTLARRQSSHHSSSLRDAVLAPLQALSQELAKQRVEVVTDIDGDIDDHAESTHDGAAIGQVCLNLYLNARDAMIPTGGGILRVSVGSVASHMVVEVSDTGTGVPDWFLPKLFQPLQTTKGDKGTGLGLAGSRAIVEAMGGTLTVATAEGRGSTFTIRIPRASALAARLAG
ncbi:MAG: sensor histidine kinase [Vicinamibacterales bacterium]